MSPPAASIDSGERRGDAVKGGPWPASLKPPSSASASSALVSGSLSITEPACIRWQPSSSSASAMSVVVSATSACTVKSSKRGKKPYAMLLGVRNEKHVFVFDIEAVRDSAVEAVKAVLAAAGGGAAGNVSEEVAALRSAALRQNPKLKRSYQKLVNETQTLSAHDFWSAHTSELNSIMSTAKMRKSTARGLPTFLATSAKREIGAGGIGSQRATIRVTEDFKRSVFQESPEVERAFAIEIPRIQAKIRMEKTEKERREAEKSGKEFRPVGASSTSDTDLAKEAQKVFWSNYLGFLRWERHGSRQSDWREEAYRCFKPLDDRASARMNEERKAREKRARKAAPDINILNDFDDRVEYGVDEEKGRGVAVRREDDGAGGSGKDGGSVGGLGTAAPLIRQSNRHGDTVLGSMLKEDDEDAVAAAMRHDHEMTAMEDLAGDEVDTFAPLEIKDGVTTRVGSLAAEVALSTADAAGKRQSAVEAVRDATVAWLTGGDNPRKGQKGLPLSRGLANGAQLLSDLEHREATARLARLDAAAVLRGAGGLASHGMVPKGSLSAMLAAASDVHELLRHYWASFRADGTCSNPHVAERVQERLRSTATSLQDADFLRLSDERASAQRKQVVQALLRCVHKAGDHYEDWRAGLGAA